MGLDRLRKPADPKSRNIYDSSIDPLIIQQETLEAILAELVLLNQYMALMTNQDCPPTRDPV